MKKENYLTLVLVVPLVFSTIAQSKHNPATLYPTYDGLIMAGYQGWFRAAGDGSSSKHYAYGDEERSGIDMWPDVSEYEKTYETPFMLRNGKHARFFSSVDKSTTDLHFKWMHDYGLDGVFMQRFFDDTREGPRKTETTSILRNALQAASEHRRAIAVMYDLSGLKGSGEDCSTIIADWKYLVDEVGVTNQKGEKTYLHHQGKPVVVIWGVGFPDRPYNIRNIGLERLINFLKNDPKYGNCTVMLGVPTAWRTLDADCVNDNYLHELIRMSDLIMPWAVQRFSPLLHNDIDRYRDILIEDMKWCRSNHVDYVPCVYPGFSWHNLSVRAFPDDIKPVASIPRQGGRFYWQLITTAINSGANKLYVAMFDEVNEGTAIFKVTDEPPLGKKTQFADLDHKPTDHYLWLTGEGAKILRGEKPMSIKLPERN
jgi:hypothetical protein